MGLSHLTLLRAALVLRLQFVLGRFLRIAFLFKVNEAAFMRRSVFWRLFC